MEDQANQSQPPSDEEEEDSSMNEEEKLVAKVNTLMDKITSVPDNPKPNVLHALASTLEAQESRHMEESGHSSSATHNIGRLGGIIRKNDEFFELISSKFLSETRYSTSVQAAAARLVLCCSRTWIDPHVFEEPVLKNIKNWLMDDVNTGLSAKEQNLKASDSAMLKTYSTGLLAVCLDGGDQVLKDVLASGLSAKLMRYLRLRVLGETSGSEQHTSHLIENRHSSVNTSVRVRDDGRGRFCQLLESSHLDDARMIEESSLDDLTLESGQDRSMALESEPVLSSAGSGSRLVQGTSVRDGSMLRNADIRRVPDSKKTLSRITPEALVYEREDNDDCFQECRIGSKDISDLVRKAVQAAEAEAANAPEEAVRAAGDAAADLVKTAATEVIINSEVWDLRKFSLLCSVPSSLDQTEVTFNARGDVMYAILRRNLEDVMSAVHKRRAKHPLFAAFRTVDAINYSDIATIPVDRCVLDFATEPTDSFVGLITMDDQGEMYSSARIYEVGRRRPNDDDSDPDDVESEEEDEDDDDDDDDADVDPLLGPGLLGESDSDADDMSNEDDDEDNVSEPDDEEDGDFILDDVDFDGGTGILEIVTEGDEDDDDSQVIESVSSDEDDFSDNAFGY